MKTRGILAVLCALAFVAGPGCGGKKIRSSGSLTSDLVFPYGIYRQRVEVAVPTAHQNYSFDGVVQTSAQWIRVIVLSPFGTTVAKIEENRQTGAVTSESYLEVIKKHESKVLEYYTFLKKVLLLPKTPGAQSEMNWKEVNREGLPLRIEVQSEGKSAAFVFSKYDEKGIPESVDIEAPKIRVRVEVTGYEI